MPRRNASERAADIRLVRAELRAMRRVHGRYVSDPQVAALVAEVGDAGVAADALVMFPRPAWVEVLCGPFPASLELASLEDVASVEEFGPLGEGT